MFRLFLLLGFITPTLYAGTCSSISRTNNSASTVLTSTKYNADHNVAYAQLNDLDGGCITDGTLEFSSLATAEFGVITNGTERGCEVTRSDGNTLSVASCLSAVNGNQINTATAATVTWGCTGCAAEVASTEYFIYIKDGSNGFSLDGQLLISTTGPSSKGYDGSSNKALARFRNDGASSIASGNISQFTVTGFGGRGVSDVCSFEDWATGEGQRVNGTVPALRPLNRLASDVRGSCSFASFAAHQVTINQAGYYRFEGSGVFRGTGESILYLANVTTGDLPLLSHNLEAGAGESGNLRFQGYLYVPAATVFEMRANYSLVGNACGSPLPPFGLEVLCSKLLISRYE